MVGNCLEDFIFLTSKLNVKLFIQSLILFSGAKIEFIDYQKGSQEGWVRLSYPYEAKIIIKKMIVKKLNIAGADLIFRVLSKKDEKQYHRKVVNAIYELQIKAKGLGRKLKKAGYKYATKYEPDNDRKKDN